MRPDVHWRSYARMCKRHYMPNRTRSTIPASTVIQMPRKTKALPDPRERPFNEALGARLKAWRTDMGWSQRRMATALSIGEDAYKKYEYGSRGFPSYLLPVLRTITDRSVAEWVNPL